MSSATVSSGSGEGIKKRRKRHALSCVACKERKIKCDRNVPGCGSCTVRGIARHCRWGDERDFDIVHATQEESTGQKKKPCSDPVDVDDVVERVLKRLKSEISSASPSSNPASTASSPVIPFPRRPPLQLAANIIPCTAFEGIKPQVPDIRLGRMISKGKSYDIANPVNNLSTQLTLLSR